MTEKEIEVGDIVMDKMTGEFIRIESVSGKGAFDKDLIKIRHHHREVERDVAKFPEGTRSGD